MLALPTLKRLKGKMDKLFQRRELNAVLNFATQAHAGQKRKYTDEDYIIHPMRVAFAGIYFGDRTTTKPNAVAAALLHDIIEDTAVTFEELRLFLSKIFFDGEDVAEIMHLVMSLTDIYTKDNFPNLNRKERKEKELFRMEKTFNRRLFLIKLIDMIDNQTSINKYDPEFAKVFNVEKNNFIEVFIDKRGKERRVVLYYIECIKHAFAQVNSMPIHEHAFKKEDCWGNLIC